MNMTTNFLCAETDADFLKTIITGDELLVFGYKPQSFVWKSITKGQRGITKVQNKTKVLCIFFLTKRVYFTTNMWLKNQVSPNYINHYTISMMLHFVNSQIYIPWVSGRFIVIMHQYILFTLYICM